MVRLSALRNIPVICDGKPLGLFQGIGLDEAQRRVEAIVVSCGFRGKRVVLAQDIGVIADGFILAQKARKYKRSFEKPLCMFVRDTSGLLAGRITDYAIDEHTLRIVAIEMASGYLPSERRRRLWIYAFARASDQALELTIPAASFDEPNLPGEENEKCACLP